MSDSTSSSPEPEPTCRCGHTRAHRMVDAEAQYSPLGWVLVTLGASVRPVRVRYRCRRCDHVFATTTDPEVLAAHL